MYVGIVFKWFEWNKIMQIFDHFLCISNWFSLPSIWQFYLQGKAQVIMLNMRISVNYITKTMFSFIVVDIFMIVDAFFSIQSWNLVFTPSQLMPYGTHGYCSQCTLIHILDGVWVLLHTLSIAYMIVQGIHLWNLII